MSSNKQLLNQAEAAEFLGTTVGTLNTWRHHGKIPLPFVRWGRCIRYKKSDLENFIENNKVSASS